MLPYDRDDQPDPLDAQVAPAPPAPTDMPATPVRSRMAGVLAGLLVLLVGGVGIGASRVARGIENVSISQQFYDRIPVGAEAADVERMLPTGDSVLTNDLKRVRGTHTAEQPLSVLPRRQHPIRADDRVPLPLRRQPAHREDQVRGSVYPMGKLPPYQLMHGRSARSVFPSPPDCARANNGLEPSGGRAGRGSTGALTTAKTANSRPKTRPRLASSVATWTV
jgi:hypothetical protein